MTYELADLYISRGYESDYRQAATLLRQISDEMPKAAARLGRLYMDGRGMAKDYKTAFNWLKKVFISENLNFLKYRSFIVRNIIFDIFCNFIK